MRILLRLTIAAFLVLALLAPGRKIQATSIAPVTIQELFAQADQVALVKVLSGDSEHYSVAVYKAIVENAYKGTANGQTIFFGPFISHEVGSEYVVFLKRGEPIKVESTDQLPYGASLEIGRVMYAGYAIMKVGYECVFQGKDIDQQCDQSVQLNPEQIILPKGIKLFPEGDATAITNYKKWIRKKEFLALLHP